MNLSTSRALALGALLVLALVAFSSLRSPPAEPPPAPRPPSVPSPSPAPQPVLPDLSRLKAEQTAVLWARFDGLPAEQKTKDRLTDTLDEAAQIVKGEPRLPQDRALLERQGIEFRRRAAPLARVGAVATGEQFDVLVPAPDPTECARWGRLWSQEGANLALLGFRRIECPGSPPESWELKR